MNTIDSILQSLPSREDLASAIGIENRSSATDFLPALGLFGTGMLFGAGLALMFAPKSGNEMRRDLSEGMQQWGNQARGWSEGYGQQGYGGSSQGREYGQHEQGRQQSGQASWEQQHQPTGTHTSSGTSGDQPRAQSEYGRQMSGQGESSRQQMSGQQSGQHGAQGSTQQGRQMSGHGTESRSSTETGRIGGSSGGRNI